MPKDLLKKDDSVKVSSTTVYFCPMTETAVMPKYAKKGDAGMDIYSDENVYLDRGKSKTISSGMRIKIPEGTVGFVCPRSGLASKYSVTVGNAPGVLDSGFSGELKVILIAHGEGYRINKGDRIAQLVIVPFISCEMILKKDFDGFNTERGSDGFGSSGK